MAKPKPDLASAAQAQSPEGRREAAVARAEAEFSRSVGRTRRFQWILLVLLFTAVVVGVTLIPPTPEQQTLRDIQENDAQTIRFVVPALSIALAPNEPQTQTQPRDHGPAGDEPPPPELTSRAVVTEPAFLASLVLDSLVRVVDGELRPSLCVEWSTDDAGLTWRLRARDGIRFHDGSAFETRHIAEAVRWLPGVVRVALQLPEWWLSSPPPRDAPHPPVEAVITLAEPDADWIRSDAVTRLHIAKAGGVGGVIGTGRFRIAEYTLGATLALSAVRMHHLPAPAAATLRFAVVKEAAARENAVNAYEADIATSIPRSRDAALLARPRLRTWGGGGDSKTGWVIGPRIGGEPGRAEDTSEIDLMTLEIRSSSEWWIEDK